ncbi:MAG TPA: divalent-cation tolerance protein CutA [Acidobacteriota bacterium]|nr:divalent-cation tolerance protein CutA [Acidobacteriota bacterium]
MSDVRIVLSTIDSRDKAEQIAETLVKERLAACVNILPELVSVYKWKDALEKEKETLMLIKTSANRLEALSQRIRSLHPYEVPEIIFLEVDGGNSEYLDWVLVESRA